MGFALRATAKGPSANSSDPSWTLQPCKCLSAWEMRQDLSRNDGDKVHLLLSVSPTSRGDGQGKQKIVG